jgi:trigger factor
MDHEKDSPERFVDEKSPIKNEIQDAAAEKKSQDNPLQIRFQVTMSDEEMNREIENLAGQYSQKVKMPGFRQGKVPVDVVKKVYRQALQEEVIQQAVSKLAFARIERDKIAIASEPAIEKMDHAEGKGLVADIAVEVLPDVVLPELEKLRVQIPAAELRGETYDESRQVALVLDGNKRSQPVKERPIREEDLVLLLAQSTDVAGKRKWPRQETHYMMQKENEAEISGLFEELLGKSAGDTLTFQRTYPGTAAKKAWSGKTIEHQLEIKSIFELKRPELDDHFLKTLGLKSTEEFKVKLKEEFENRQARQREEKILDKIYEQLLAACSFPVPRSLVEQEAARRLTQNQRPLHFKDDEEKNKLRELLLTQAEQAVRLSLILEQVRKQYGLEVSPEDMEKEYAELAKRNGLPEKEIKKYYAEQKRQEELKDHLLNVKINGLIKEKIRVKEV